VSAGSLAVGKQKRQQRGDQARHRTKNMNAHRMMLKNKVSKWKQFARHSYATDS
jgi:hypothetical protein